MEHFITYSFYHLRGVFLKKNPPFSPQPMAVHVTFCRFFLPLLLHVIFCLDEHNILYQYSWLPGVFSPCGAFLSL